jgi:hypothetical protein
MKLALMGGYTNLQFNCAVNPSLTDR